MRMLGSKSPSWLLQLSMADKGTQLFPLMLQGHTYPTSSSLLIQTQRDCSDYCLYK